MGPVCPLFWTESNLEGFSYFARNSSRRSAAHGCHRRASVPHLPNSAEHGGTAGGTWGQALPVTGPSPRGNQPRGLGQPFFGSTGVNCRHCGSTQFLGVCLRVPAVRAVSARLKKAAFSPNVSGSNAWGRGECLRGQRAPDGRSGPKVCAADAPAAVTS